MTGGRAFETSDEATWPLTERTRFVAWRGCLALAAMLDPVDIDEDDFVKKMFPPLTRDQPAEWWREVHKAALQMAEHLRAGTDRAPRTPAEEAVLYLVCIEGHESGMEQVEALPELQRAFEELPATDEDFEWDEIMPALVGDEDIAMLWNMSLDGVGDPENEVHQATGMRDYRPQNWHRLYE